MKYYYSNKEESAHYTGPYDSIDDAKREAEADGLDVYYIGEEDKYSIRPNGYSVIDWICEDLDMEAYEDAGEIWFNEIDNQDELGDEIDNLIIDFLNKKGITTQVTRIINIKSYEKDK